MQQWLNQGEFNHFFFHILKNSVIDVVNDIIHHNFKKSISISFRPAKAIYLLCHAARKLKQRPNIQRQFTFFTELLSRLKRIQSAAIGEIK